jgi:hypothetical protein
LDSSNLLDVFRHKLGEPSLSAVFRDGDLMKTAVREIVAAYNEWEQPTAPPTKVAGGLRPVFAPSALSSHYEVDELLNSLLLVHSAAIVVPDSINYATRLVSLLANLEDAVDAGLVHILSERVLNEPPGFFDELLAENAELALPDSLSQDERVVRVSEFIDVADIALTLDACASHPDKLDLVCRTPGQRDWLRTRIEELPREAIKSQDSLAYMSELLALKLPAAKIPISDMVALRAGGAFDRWRQALATTIQEATAIDDDIFLDPSSGRKAAMRERMAAAAEEMASESSGWIRNATAEMTNFGIACAGGVRRCCRLGRCGRRPTSRRRSLIGCERARPQETMRLGVWSPSYSWSRGRSERVQRTGAGSSRSKRSPSPD